MEEERLVHQLREKRRRALHIAIRDYTGYVSAVAGRTLGQSAGREDLEEIVSDVFLALWRHAEELDPAYGLRSWLASVARNKAIDRLRRLTPVQPIPEDAPAIGPGPEELAERAQVLEDAVKNLPEPDRTLFLRYYYGDEPLKKVARSLDLKESTTVESSVSDGREAFLVVRVDALTAEVAEKLMRDDFVNMDTFSIYAVKDPSVPIPGDMGVEEKTGVNIPQRTSSYSMGEVMAARTETSRTWRSVASIPEGEVSYIRARLCYMSPDKVVEVPLTPAESVTLEIGAKGQGLPTFENDVGGPITVDRVTLSPFTFRVEYTRHDQSETEPRIFFPMADGTLRTQSQMMHATDGEGRPGKAVKNYQFFQVLDMSQLKSLVVFGREYPMDGSVSTEVVIDPALDVFRIPLMPPLAEGDGYTIPVRDLCDGLGVDNTWDEKTNSAVLTYRGVTITITPGSKTAIVNGQTVELYTPADVVDGQLSSTCQIFQDYWGVDAFVYRTRNADGTNTWYDWIIIP